MAEWEPESIEVPVAGGMLAATRWPARCGAGPFVLAVHGITANGLSWGAVADALPEAELVAPDLRGRGLSRATPGPYGLATHADDLVALLDHLGRTEPVVLAGHSMGAFVAALAAVRHPGRFSGVVLVDGGVGLPAPAGADLDEVLTAVIGPAMRKLELEFASVEEYRDFWRVHPSFGDLWTATTQSYVDRDLVGTAPHLRSGCVGEAIRADGADVLYGADVLAAIHRMPVPASLLWAERGMLDGPQGLYSAESLAGAGLPESIDVRQVADTNHYSILLGAKGSAEVAGALRATLAVAGTP